MSDPMNESDIAAVITVARAYYDGMMSGDEGKLVEAFHPRACIVGNEDGELYWATLEEFAAACREAAADAGPHEWQIDDISFRGDTALVRVGDRYAGVWYTDDLSMIRIDGAWRIVHKTYYTHPAA